MNVLITGGSSDIAHAIIQHRLMRGDQVIITSSNQESLQRTLEKYQVPQGGVSGFVYDFKEPEACQDDLNRLLKKRAIDAVILNAFTRVTTLHRIHEKKYSSIQSYLMQNLNGNIWLIHQLLPHMLENNFGRWILVSSVSVVTGTSRYGVYIAAKAALEGLFLNLAVDYGKNNIFFNIIRLGIIETERNAAFWKGGHYQEKLSKLIPAGYLGKPEQLAEAFDPLLSSTSYMTGSVMTLSGGLPLLCSEGLLLP